MIITNENYREILEGEQPVVFDFWAEWCGPCRMVSPIIDELAEEYSGRVVIGKIDVETNNDIAAEYGIRSIPTILFFKGGQMVDKHVGLATKDLLTKKVDMLL